MATARCDGSPASLPHCHPPSHDTGEAGTGFPGPWGSALIPGWPPGPCLLHQAPLCNRLPSASLLLSDAEKTHRRGLCPWLCLSCNPLPPAGSSSFQTAPSARPNTAAHQPAHPPGTAPGQSSSGSLSTRALPATFPLTYLSEKPAQHEDEAVCLPHPSSPEGPEARGAGCTLTT